MMVGEEVRRNPNGVSNGGDAHTSSSSWSSSSSSSYLSLSPVSENGGECGLDGMELEAARALACFSRTVVRESGTGKRAKRFKNRSPARDWENSTHGRGLASVPQDNKAIKVTVDKKIKVEQISEIPTPFSNCSANYLSCSGRKMRQNLTEAEREARRMRRVLANRESARQTIQRRQALQDGLTKKVSELSLDNLNMKMVKEQVMIEYMSLKNKNKQLKDELAMAIACNIMGAEATSPPLETSSLQSKHPILVNIKPPFMPGIWPPWPVTAAHAGLCYDDSGTHKATEPRRPLNMPPSSWFCSLQQMSASCHLISAKWKDKEVDFLTPTTIVEEKPVMQVQNQRENPATHALAPSKDKTVKVNQSRKLDIDLNSRSVMPELSLDALNHCSSVDDEPKRYTAVVNTINKPAHRTEVVQVFTEDSAKFLDATAAAAARRRRKEIRKLKHLCCRPIVLHI